MHRSLQILLLLAAGGRAFAAPLADLIVTHARVWTVDPARPQAEAVAVLGERIVAVGSATEIAAWRGSTTRVIDAGGRLLLPGFDDAHVHFMSGGSQLASVQLKDARSAEEFVRRIGERSTHTPRGEWITQGDWDETLWAVPRLPTRQMIDPVTGDTPVFVSRYDGHMGLANTAALKAAGITGKTPDPPGGTIVHDAHGEPTGALKDAAEDLMSRVIPPPTHAQRLLAVRRALEEAAHDGVTSVQDMNPEYGDIAVYAELRERGELTARIYAAPLITQVEDQAKIGFRHAFGDAWLRVGALKGYADGSLGSRTAYFFEPFSDEPGNSGLLAGMMQPLSLMRERMRRADAAGLQLCTHAIGDRAISTVLDLYAELAAADQGAGGSAPRRDRRWRIEHAQHMAAKDFARMAQLGVIASVQPYHAIDDGRWAEARIGHERASRTYAFRTFLEQGVHLAFGTDWDVAPLNPMLSVYAAVTRATLDGRNPNGWFPEQKLTVAEAVEAYTLGSAYAEFQEQEKGSITPGKLADMVLLSEDIFHIPPERIRTVQVVTTIVGGRVVYEHAR